MQQTMAVLEGGEVVSKTLELTTPSIKFRICGRPAPSISPWISPSR